MYLNINKVRKLNERRGLEVEKSVWRFETEFERKRHWLVD